MKNLKSFYTHILVQNIVLGISTKEKTAVWNSSRFPSRSSYRTNHGDKWQSVVH
jgi:hypothetical protein